MKGKRTVEGSETTPFRIEQIREAYEILQSLPVIGEPIRPGTRGRPTVEGETYEQMRAYLVPAIVNLYRRGYNRAKIKEKVMGILRVSKYNRYLNQLIRDGHQAYLESLMKEEGS